MAVTVSPDLYAHTFDERVAEHVSDVAARVPSFAHRLQAAGLDPDELNDVAALDRLPVLTKDDLINLQASAPPFGGLLAEGAKIRRVFQSPGPLYEPEPAMLDPWRVAPALECAGFGPDDIVLNAASYHLSPLGAMFEQAVFALGGTVVPAGVGNMELQATCCRDLGVTAYLGLPSYLKALLECAQDAGLEPDSWPLERAFVTAEPLPPSLRAWLEQRVPTVREGYGTAEAGILGYQCARLEGLHVSSTALVQVCDLTTGEALWDGSEGEVVVTLFSPDYPLDPLWHRRSLGIPDGALPLRPRDAAACRLARAGRRGGQGARDVSPSAPGSGRGRRRQRRGELPARGRPGCSSRRIAMRGCGSRRHRRPRARHRSQGADPLRPPL